LVDRGGFCAKMYVSFRMYSDAQMQLRLHKKLRIKIPEWEKQCLIRDCEAELTYHHKGNIESDFLQSVLNLDMTSSEGENLDLSPTEDNQIPKEINEYIENLCKENQIRLRKLNHDKEMNDARMKEKAKGNKYYYDLSNKEIMRVCSSGTRIALGILSIMQENRVLFENDVDLKKYILDQITQKLGVGFEPDKDKFWFALHEILNTLGIWGYEEQIFAKSGNNYGLELIKNRSLS